MRKSILIICGLVLAFCLWLLLHWRAEVPNTDGGALLAMTVTNQNPATAPKPAMSSPASTVPAVILSHTAVANAQNAVLPTVKELLQKPIEFYGKVIDEKSNAVVGANISFRWDDLTAEDWTRTSTTGSDSEGLFSLHDKRGATLIVSVGKDGYYTPQGGQGSFHYAFGNPSFSSDPHNPIVFYLRKKGRGESLIERDYPPGFTQIWQLHHDGTPITLDLLNGSQNVSGNGQLKLELWRDVSNMKRQPFDWKLQLSILNGGLIETNEEFAFQAPEGGYQPSVVIDMPTTNQPWMSEVRSKYYIQLPDGKYGRIDFYLLPRNGVFTIHSAINPTGSRNLEPK